jgi:hypothetical protein
MYIQYIPDRGRWSGECPRSRLQRDVIPVFSLQRATPRSSMQTCDLLGSGVLTLLYLGYISYAYAYLLCYICALSSALFLLLNVSIISAGSATNAMLGTLDRRKAQRTYDAAAALDLHDKPLKLPQEILLCYVQARQSLPS